jgi:hypothetical protein
MAARRVARRVGGVGDDDCRVSDDAGRDVTHGNEHHTYCMLPARDHEGHYQTVTGLYLVSLTRSYNMAT